MQAAETANRTENTISPARAWVLHLWSFLLPLINLTFLLTGPHSAWAAIAWTAPIWILVGVDNRAPGDLRQPKEGGRRWIFDLQLYALAALQIANHVALGFMAAKVALWPWAELGTAVANMLGAIVLSGTTAGYSGIVLAHELVHRRKAHQHFLGRVLLMFVCYEHFATEHIRGHHPRIGTPDDPATARFDEDFHTFFWRTVPAQFKSAWQLEKVRLGDARMAFTDRRMLRHRVLQGVLGELAIVAAYFALAGLAGGIFFLLQARAAITLLEVVNYIEHWGLVRREKAVTTVDSWDTDNWFTLHTLVGLSRHSDHHARASRPYHLLRRFEESPKMPLGYYGTVLMALFGNERYRELATAELERKKLGPFREPAQSGTAVSHARELATAPKAVAS